MGDVLTRFSDGFLVRKITISFLSATRELSLCRKTFTSLVLNMAVVVNVASSKLKFVTMELHKQENRHLRLFPVVEFNCRSRIPYCQTEVREVPFSTIWGVLPFFAFLALLCNLERYPTD